MKPVAGEVVVSLWMGGPREQATDVPSLAFYFHTSGGQEALMVSCTAAGPGMYALLCIRCCLYGANIKLPRGLMFVCAKASFLSNRLEIGWLIEGMIRIANA